MSASPSSESQARWLTPATRMGLSISIATGLYGISFGALSVASGLNLWQTMALSALMFTGGSQFAFIGVIAGGGSGMAAVGASTLLGVRNAIYGVQMSQVLGVSGLKRLLAAHWTIDESTATAAGQDSWPSSVGASGWLALACFCFGICLRCWGPCLVTRWAIRAASGWTVRRWRRFWACCGRV